MASFSIATRAIAPSLSRLFAGSQRGDQYRLQHGNSFFGAPVVSDGQALQHSSPAWQAGVGRAQHGSVVARRVLPVPSCQVTAMPKVPAAAAAASVPSAFQSSSSATTATSRCSA